MYSQYPTAASPYTSPPPPPMDPYRASPIPVSSRQPYGTFSPPPMPPSTNPAAYMRSPPPPAGYGYQPQPGHPPPSSRSRYPGPGYSNGTSQAAPPPQQRHKGTLAPGQIVQVGDQSVRIEKYLSEGGYAHVYLTTSDKPIYPPKRDSAKASASKARWGEKGYTQHCLKRIAFEDESVWADVRKEIEVMKALPPNPHLTQYLGSAHTKLPRGGYEVYILMEFCSGGGIIDLLNKRLRDRLKEIEILNIFTDVCEAVAAMHFLRQPLLHRDLKIENVLSSPSGQPPTPQRPTPLSFKLCDFGSTTFPATQPAGTKLEAEALALDLNKNTTLQYRSPEMVEPMLGLAVGLPSDVWALGVLLYKLCYYTTPFEEHGTLAIVNAKYTFPQYPPYSPKLQHLIASMLVEQPVRRPSVFEVLKVAHEMSGTRPEIDYPIPARSFASPAPSQQQPKPSSKSSTNLLDFTSPSSSIDRAPSKQPDLASTVQPQRRGRPTSHRAGMSNHGQQPQHPPQTVQPPMPVPPSITHQQPTSSGNGPKIQVTGGRAPSPKKSGTGSVDAFGMPALSASNQTKSRSGSTASGFGDSFGVAQPKPQPRPGFTDSFSGRQGSSLSVSPATSNARQQSSFSSFDMPRTSSPSAVTAASRSPDPASSIPDGEVSFETRFPSIETLSSGDALSPPLPSTDTSRPGSAQQNLISPITSPPMNTRKPSIMGNMTGGDMLSKHQHFSAVGPGMPQPRSTHVTGTAFKQAQGGMLSPDPGSTTISTSSSFGASVSSRKDYFDGVEAKPLVSPGPSQVTSPRLDVPTPGMPQDLMTGDDASLGGMTLRPTASRMSSDVRGLPRPPSANSNAGANAGANANGGGNSMAQAQVPPTTGHSRPLLPHIDSKRPDNNIDSESWSPLERLKSASSVATGVDSTAPRPAASRQETRGTQSSSDEEGPESADRRKPSRQGTAAGLADRRSMFERKPAGEISTSPTKAKASSPVKQASSFAKPSSPTTQPAGLNRGNAGGYGLTASRSDGISRGRPVSMYNMPPPSTSRMTTRMSPPLSAGAAGAGGMKASTSSTSSTGLPVPPSDRERPRHVRKGSINDIVSKYESLTSPTVGVMPREKPSVAAKPAGLRKPSNDLAGASTGASPTKASRKPLEKPAKPSNKPDLIRPMAVRHGDLAYSNSRNSASGRSFGATASNGKPALNTSMSALSIATSASRLEDKQAPDSAASATSGKSSPERQQPVNALIARWNQGSVGTGAGGGDKKPLRRGEGFI